VSLARAWWAHLEIDIPARDRRWHRRSHSRKSISPNV